MNAQKSKLVPCLGVVTVQAIETAGPVRFLKCKVTISQGEFEGLTILTRIPDPFWGGNRQSARSSGLQTLTRIFEAAKVFRHDKPHTYRIFDGVSLDVLAVELHEKRGAFMSEIANGVFARLTEWLSPNPQSSGFKGWQRLASRYSQS